MPEPTQRPAQDRRTSFEIIQVHADHVFLGDEFVEAPLGRQFQEARRHAGGHVDDG